MQFAALAVVIFALGAVMVPVLRRTYQTSLTLGCQQQLTRIFAGVRSYALSFGGWPPSEGVRAGAGSAGGWYAQSEPFLDTGGSSGRPGSLWNCPAGGPYVGNAGIFQSPTRTLGAFKLKREIGVVADGKPGGGRVGDTTGIAWRHRGGANVVFLDGRVQWILKSNSRWMRKHWDKPL